MDAPETRYVTVGEGQVAYQIAGDGPDDLVWCFGMGNNVELLWHVPYFSEIAESLSAGRRLILFDRRGSGASDRVPLNAVPTWEEYAEDLMAVLDSAGSERTAVVGQVDSGAIAMLFAAIHPERVSHLILMNASARYLEADDYSAGTSSEVIDSLVAWIGTNWGTERLIRDLLPTLHDDRENAASLSRLNRSSLTPRAAAMHLEYYMRDLDVRRFLPLIAAPTLVIQSRDNPIFSAEMGRYLAQHIPNATFVERPGSDMIPAPADEAVAEIVEFLTGVRPETETHRVLKTVLFTDIVGSTERAALLGDHRWRTLLDAHDREVRHQLRRFQGREIKSTGDGWMASFDGPARGIRCTKAIIDAIRALGIEIRAGLHTGECEVRGDDLGGLAVHIAARVGALALPGETLVSGTVKDLVVGSGIEFDERGERQLKGVPGIWRLFAVRT